MTPSTLTSFCLLSFLIGVILGGLARLYPSPGVWFLGLGLLLSLSLFKQFFLLPLLFSLLTGVLYISSWRTVHFTTYQFGEEYSFQAIVSEPPDIRRVTTLLSVIPTSPISENRRTTPILIIAPRYPEWQYGDLLEVKGVLEKPQKLHGFNYPLYLERFQTYALMSKPKQLTPLVHNRGSPALALLYRLKSHLEKVIQATIPEPESSFLGGILLGSKRAIPDDITSALRQTGTSHMVVVSGSNITILLTLLARLAPFRGKRQQFWLIVLLGIFVTLLTGAPASVMRGSCIAILGSYLQTISRRAWPVPFILTSMTFLVLGNPLLLVADPGFQISFASFAGIAFFSSPIEQWLDRLHFSQKWPAVLKSSIAQTTAVTLSIAPLSLFTFHELSLIGLVVNPLILWILPALTLLGLLLITLSWLPGVVFLIRLPLWLVLHAILSIIQTFAQLPLGLIHLNSAHVPT